MYAFDVAYEMTRQPVRELLGQAVAQFQVDASKRSPKELFFYRPQMVRLPPIERIGARGPIRLERTVSGRFHLQDGHRTIDEKLKTLDEMYQLLRHDQTTRWMMILEITIVLLFVVDIIKSILGH